MKLTLYNNNNNNNNMKSCGKNLAETNNSRNSAMVATIPARNNTRPTGIKEVGY